MLRYLTFIPRGVFHFYLFFAEEKKKTKNFQSHFKQNTSLTSTLKIMKEKYVTSEQTSLSLGFKWKRKKDGEKNF